MKKLFLIFSLIIISININSHTLKSIKILVPRFIDTILLDEIVIKSTKLEKRIMPESFIPDYVFKNQLYVESRFKHFIENSDGTLSLIKSPAGAVGIAQFLPSTWKWLKKRKILPKSLVISRKSDQLVAQRLFMNFLANKSYGIKYNKIRLALASYNAGSGRVSRLIKKYGLQWETHLPKETKKYLKIILT